MSEPVLRIPGQVIRDLCATLGVDETTVYKIEIEPTKVLVLHRFRQQDGRVLLNGDRSNPLRERTEIRIDYWSEAGA